jgi:hypothetical protein
LDPIKLKNILILFFVVLVMSRFLLIDWLEFWWKPLEYLGLLLGGIFGLVAATIVANHFIVGDKMKAWDDLVDKNAVYVSDVFGEISRGSCGPNFSDDIPQKDAAQICHWITSNRTNILDNDEHRRLIPMQALDPAPTTSSRAIRDMKAEAQQYNEVLAEFKDLQKQYEEKPYKDKTCIEKVNDLVSMLSIAFGPYFLAIGLALKLTEVHAEIRKAYELE